MKVFKSYTFEWWQIALYETALLSIGVIIGTHWHEFFQPYLILLAIVGAVLSIYVWYVSFVKKSNRKETTDGEQEK